MDLGICCSMEAAPLAFAAGFDYVELPANEIAKAADLTPYAGIAIRATNLFFPSGASLFGDQPFDWSSYGETLFPKVQRLGIRLMVIGSGPARMAPGLELVSECQAKFVRMVGGLQELASPFGITLAPEALNRTETNVWNSNEGIAGALAAHGLSYTCDIYHALVGWAHELGGIDKVDQSTIDERLTDLPAHVHLADFVRNVPEEDDGLVLGCLRRLKSMGYEGRISLETPSIGSEHWPEAQARLRGFLRQIW